MTKQAAMPAEMAEQEFERFCDAYRIDVDTSDESEELQNTVASAKRTIIKAFCRGELTLTDEGRPVYVTGDGLSVEFKPFSGAMMLSMDKAKKDDNQRRMFLFISEITNGGVTPGKLDKRDVNVLFALATLFLAL